MEKRKTIKEKEKDLRKSTIFSCIFSTVFATYIGFSYQAYVSTLINANSIDFSEKINGTISEVVKNPLYFLPIYQNGTFCYPFWQTLVLVTLIPLFSFLGYSINKMRVHHDVNTLKGSSEWANIPELMNRYAEWEKK